MKRFLLLVSLFFTAVLLHNEAKAQVQVVPSDTAFSVSTSANPFDDQVIINITHGSKTITGLKVFDAIGKEVSGEIPVTIVNRGGIISYTLDFTTVRPGVYFCNIYSDKGIIETRKLFRAAR